MINVTNSLIKIIKFISKACIQIPYVVFLQANVVGMKLLLYGIKLIL